MVLSKETVVFCVPRMAHRIDIEEENININFMIDYMPVFLHFFSFDTLLNLLRNTRKTFNYFTCVY